MVGAPVSGRMAEMMDRHQLIGDVRGIGLLMGNVHMHGALLGMPRFQRLLYLIICSVLSATAAVALTVLQALCVCVYVPAKRRPSTRGALRSYVLFCISKPSQSFTEFDPPTCV
jgi:hypothetical protein